MMPFKINVNSLTRSLVTLYIFLFSYLIAQFYTAGDQFQYQSAFKEVKGLGLIEAFAAYHIYLSSDEPIYFLISWVSSNLNFSKDIIMSIANALLANILFRVLKKLNTSIYLIVFIICTNYYLFALYFAAERLKFAFIFLFLAFLADKNAKKKYLYLFLSFISHVQVLVIMASSLFANTIQGLLIFAKRFKFKFNPRSLIVFFVLALTFLFLNEHLLQKFTAYSESTSSKELISNTFQTILFLFLSLLYTDDKRRTILIFVFILISASILGSSRVTMMAYMFFMYYSLKIHKGFNLAIMTTSLYFSIKSIFFIINVFQFGHAYP
jgi:hypothetical protein